MTDPGLQQECELRRELFSIVRMNTTDVRKVNMIEAVIMREKQAALEEVPEPGAGDILPGPEFTNPDEIEVVLPRLYDAPDETIRIYDDGKLGGEAGGE